MTTRDIRAKAKEIIQDPEFKASENWCYRFMKRNNLSLSRGTIKEEVELKEWFLSRIKSGHSVTLREIRAKAKEIIQVPEFKASEGWCYRFMKQNDLFLSRGPKLTKDNSEDIKEDILPANLMVDSTAKEDKIDSHGMVESTTKDISNDHIPSEVPEKRFSCGVCGALFQTKQTLKLHLTRHDSENCGTVDVVPVIQNQSENSTDTLVPKKRSSYNASFKLKVVKFATKHQNNRLTAREFNICEKLVRDWRRVAPQLATLPQTSDL